MILKILLVKGKNVKYISVATKNILLNRIKREKADGFIKTGVFTDEIVWGSNSYIVPKMDKKKQKSFKKGMFLFGMVRKDVKLFMLNNTDIVLPKSYPQIEYRNDLDERLFGKITATDLNHAYWRIALNFGIISEYTYMKGLPDEFKAVRLAALSTMGMPKKYFKIKNGEVTSDFKLTVGDEAMQIVYKLIRLTCYKYMYQVKRLLKRDFLCYKTDCIYYIDTANNRKIVDDFFEKRELLTKRLE